MTALMRTNEEYMQVGRRWLLRLTLLPGDPQDPECDRTELALCLALRGALRSALEVLPVAGGDRTSFFGAGEASQARRTISSIVDALRENLPAEQQWWMVLDTGAQPHRFLRRFATEQEAAEFIGTLPEHETGRYELDGPTGEEEQP